MLQAFPKTQDLVSPHLLYLITLRRGATLASGRHGNRHARQLQGPWRICCNKNGRMVRSYSGLSLGSSTKTGTPPGSHEKKDTSLRRSPTASTTNSALNVPASSIRTFTTVLTCGL